MSKPNKIVLIVSVLGLLLAILSYFLLTTVDSEDSRGLKVNVKDHVSQKVNFYNNSYALLIGVSDYSDSIWPDLKSIPDELSDVASALENQGFIVEKNINPDGKKLESLFKDFIDKYGYDERNRLFFFYSGHGYTRRSGQKGYLVPADAPDPEKSPQEFMRKALPFTQIMAFARDSEAKHSLFLFDSCFSGSIFKTRALPEKASYVTKMTGRPVRQFMTGNYCNLLL